MERTASENTIAYRDVRRRFYDAGDEVFGPGVLSMMEYYFMKKRGCSPFAMLLSEPKVVYDEWVTMFKGEDIVKKLIENAAGERYITLLEHIKKNDGSRVRIALQGLSRATVA